MQINKKYFILLLFLLLGVNSVKAHPYYVSICQVELNSKTNSLEISLKVFADDLLLGLENAGRTKIYLGEEKENQSTDAYIYDYLKTQYKFVINSRITSFSFVGKEMEDNVVWAYLEINEVNDLSNFKVECTFLTEVLESQTNIIQVNKDGVIKNMMFNKNKTVDSLQFD